MTLYADLRAKCLTGATLSEINKAFVVHLALSAKHVRSGRMLTAN